MGKDFLITDRLRNCSRRKKREIVSRMGEASNGKILFIFFLSRTSSCRLLRLLQ